MSISDVLTLGNTKYVSSGFGFFLFFSQQKKWKFPGTDGEISKASGVNLETLFIY